MNEIMVPIIVFSLLQNSSASKDVAGAIGQAIAAMIFLGFLLWMLYKVRKM